MLSLVFKKLNLYPIMPASRGVNPLATSHNVENLSSISLYSWSHDTPILYLIYHCLNKIDIAWNLLKNIKKKFFTTAKKKLLTSGIILEM